MASGRYVRIGTQCSSGMKLNTKPVSNVGCCLYIFWAGISALIQGINMTIWADNTINWAPVWCDISKSNKSVFSVIRLTMIVASRWLIAESIGVVLSSFIINRRLYLVTTMNQVMISRQEKLSAMRFDLMLGLGIPIVWVGLCECRFVLVSNSIHMDWP